MSAAKRPISGQPDDLRPSIGSRSDSPTFDRSSCGNVPWPSGSEDGPLAATDLDPETLTATLEAAGAAATGEADDEHGRTHWEAPLRAPYRAVPVTPALFHTQGGLVVDKHARVLREDGTPIPGLYASGGAAAGISGHGAAGYLAGNGLLPALGLAFLAAEHVAGGTR